MWVANGSVHPLLSLINVICAVRRANSSADTAWARQGSYSRKVTKVRVLRNIPAVVAYLRHSFHLAFQVCYRCSCNGAKQMRTVVQFYCQHQKGFCRVVLAWCIVHHTLAYGNVSMVFAVYFLHSLAKQSAVCRCIF